MLGTAKINSQKFSRVLSRNTGEWSGMKSSRRGKLDIIAEILLFCDQQKTKTSIMYNTNLNYSQLQSHMLTLTSQGMLTKTQSKYNTTEKGYRFIELFTQLNDLMDDFNP